MCLREFCLCFRPDTDEGPDLHRPPSVNQRVEQPKMTSDGDTYQKSDSICQPKDEDANGTANGLTSPPRNFSASNEDKDADFTRKSEAAGRPIANPEKSDGLKDSTTKAKSDGLKDSTTKPMESNERAKIPPKAIANPEKSDGLKDSTAKPMESNGRAKLPPKAIAKPEKSDGLKDSTTKAMESNERAKIPPKAIASYEVLAPKDQTKAADYDGDDGERVGRKPQ